MYDALLHDLVEEARRDDDIVGVLLTGSLARGDALPGTDVDLRYILTAGSNRPFRSELRDGVLVEQGYADVASAEAKLTTHPMNGYAYLDGRILHDPQGALAGLKRQAEQRFEAYQVSDAERSTIAFLLQCSRDKIAVAMSGGDLLKAAFVAGTSSWSIMEGLWAANNRPLPPNSSIRPHLGDLSVGPPDIGVRYRQLFLAGARERVRTALDLIDWILGRLAEDPDPGGHLPRSRAARKGVASAARIADDRAMGTRRADMFVDLDTDPRVDPPPLGDERATLVGFLRWQRETLELKCSGLDAADLARRAAEPSTMSLLGLVRHMAGVERGWFRDFMAGQEAPPLFISDVDGDPDFDGAVADPAVVAEAWRLWRDEIAFTDRFVAEAPDLDVVGKITDEWRGQMSLRWVLTHMVEEYARHNGHADLLRERIDGRLGQ